MKHLSVYLIIVFLILSCQSKKGEKGKTMPNVQIQKESNESVKEYFTASGMKFILQIDHSQGESICNVKVETHNFMYNDTHNLNDLDPISDVFIADLDGNGYEELYIITMSAGSGSYSNIWGLASNKDISATPVYVPEISKEQTAKGGFFEGFRGHNLFALNERGIVSKFPVFNINDTNFNPTGGERKVQYSLIPGENSWILKPTAIIP